MYLRIESGYHALLSAIGWCLKHRIVPDAILHEDDCPLLLEGIRVPVAEGIADAFRSSLSGRISAAAAENMLSHAWHAWLSETEGIEMPLFHYFNLAILRETDPSDCIDLAPVGCIIKASRRTSRLAHSWLGLLRFQSGFVDGTEWYVAEFAPECNIIPLIADHFADRFADQSFAILDKRRGLVLIHEACSQCCLHQLTEFESLSSIRITESGQTANRIPEWSGETGTIRSKDSHEDARGIQMRSPGEIGSDNDAINRMWIQYLQHLTIPERRNTALQNKNLPKKHRTWMTEFS